jgi:L,D-transpeptidase ErfK/SrfK
MNTKNYSQKQCTCSESDPPYTIHIDISLRRLYLFQDGKLLKVYSVAVGKPQTPTPKGTFQIINKDDTPGPEFGPAWMGLSYPHIGIHGTNHPESIGHAASEGCIRMRNQDIEELFYKLPLGTKVVIE